MARSRSKSRRSTRRWKPNRSKSLPKSCFLGSDYSYPICPAGKKSPSCRGVIAAYSRAAAVAGRARKHGTRGGARARSVMRKASALRKKHGCEHTWDTFKRKSRSRKGSKKKSRSRKRSKKKSRSRRCKYGKLKHAVRTPSGGKRVCRKSRGPHRRSKKKSRSRKHSKKKSHRRSKKKSRSRKRSKKKSRSRRRRSCKFGMLKTPVKTPSGGKRYCKKRRSQKYGGNKGDESRSRRDYAKKRSHRKRH
jgi:hypothetical protein